MQFPHEKVILTELQKAHTHLKYGHKSQSELSFRKDYN